MQKDKKFENTAMPKLDDNTSFLYYECSGQENCLYCASEFLRSISFQLISTLDKLIMSVEFVCGCIVHVTKNWNFSTNFAGSQHGIW